METSMHESSNYGNDFFLLGMKSESLGILLKILGNGWKGLLRFDSQNSVLIFNANQWEYVINSKYWKFLLQISVK